MKEYYIQYYDDIDERWVFFSDKNERVLRFDSKTHAQNQIDYFLHNNGNAVPYYWLNELTPTRIIKGSTE